MPPLRILIVTIMTFSWFIFSGCGGGSSSNGGGGNATIDEGVTITPPGNLTHGVCAAVTISYTDASSNIANAQSDHFYSTSATNGTFYQTTSCSMALSGNLKIAAGSSSVSFGFIATAIGSSSLTVTSTTVPTNVVGFSKTAL